MKRVSIKRDIYLYLFGLVLSLTTVYVLMISQSYQVGLNESVKYGFLYELKLAEQEYLTNGSPPQAQSKTLQVYSEFEQLPVAFKTHFDWQNFNPDVIYEEYVAGEQEGSGNYYYAALHYVTSLDTYLYVASQYDEAIYLELFSQNPPESINQLNSAFLMVGALLLFVFVLVRLLIHRLTQPIILMSQWAQTLNLEDTEKLAHFRYNEVHHLAEQLVDSVKSQQEAIEREEFFLRAASHELRTPVSIISASGDMLTRLSDVMPRGGQRAVARINRSVTTMHNLITSLLWMSRNKLLDVEQSHINMESLVQETLANHYYLADETKVTAEIEVQGELDVGPLPQVLVEIVITNLIRNALQHTAQGKIDIVLSCDGLTISNSLNDQAQGDSDASFGIGLILIERLCQSQGWHFIQQTQKHCYFASVSFLTNTHQDN